VARPIQGRECGQNPGPGLDVFNIQHMEDTDIRCVSAWQPPQQSDPRKHQPDAGTLRKAHHRFVRTFLLVQALFIRGYQRGDHCVTPSFTWTGLCDLDKPGVSLNMAVVWMEVLLHKHDDLAQLCPPQAANTSVPRDEANMPNLPGLQ
jgi:hypothetical protein